MFTRLLRLSPALTSKSVTQYFMSPLSSTLPLQRLNRCIFNFLAALLRQLFTAIQSHSRCSNTAHQQLMWWIRFTATAADFECRKPVNGKWWLEFENAEMLPIKKKSLMFPSFFFFFFNSVCAASIFQPMLPIVTASWPSCYLVPTCTRNYRRKGSRSVGPGMVDTAHLCAPLWLPQRIIAHLLFRVRQR